MADEEFKTNLLRVIAGELYFSLGLQTSREMYGKSYTSLGIAEKNAVDQYVMSQVAANYNVLTPEFLKGQQSQPTGFQPPPDKPKLN